MTNSWHFQTLHYTLEDSRQFCDALKDAKVGVIAELCINQKIYQKYDYFYGLEWWYGLVNSLAADSTFHMTPSFDYQITNLDGLLRDKEHGPQMTGYCLFS